MYLQNFFTIFGKYKLHKATNWDDVDFITLSLTLVRPKPSNFSASQQFCLLLILIILIFLTEKTQCIVIFNY